MDQVRVVVQGDIGARAADVAAEEKSAEGVDHLHVEVRGGVPGHTRNLAGQVEIRPDEQIDDTEASMTITTARARL